MTRQLTARFRRTAEAAAFAGHIISWDSTVVTHQRGRTVIWETHNTDASYRRDLQETVHYFGSPESMYNRTKTNSSWIVEDIQLPEETPMTAPTTTTTKIVATVVREGMRVRLANRKDTALSADYITVGRVDTEGLMRKVIREDGTTYVTVGVRAKFELEPEQTEKPARAARTPRAAQTGPRLSKHAKAHIVSLSLVEGQSTTRQEWGADPMIVKSLVGKGLITVTADPAEKQRKTDLIELTEAGRAYVNADDAKHAAPTQAPASE